MFKLTARPPLAIVALLAAGLIVGTTYALMIYTAEGEADVVELAGLAKGDLDARGLQLRQPTEDESQPVSREDAQELALSMQFRGSSELKILEVQLVRLVNKDAGVDRLAWAVNFDPSTVTIEEIGGPPIASEYSGEDKAFPSLEPYSTQYAIQFIDAKTGDDIAYISRANQPGPAPN